jgi:hypothetical protein
MPIVFGLLGIYLLATSDVDAQAETAENRFLDEAVVYIGMLTHVEQRLERPHKAVSAYRLQTGDASANNLRFSIRHSGCCKWQYARKGPVVAAATIAVYERVLLLAYAEKYGRLPLFNRL